MSKGGSPPDEAERRAQRLDALLIALGVSEDPLVRYVLTRDIEYIEHQGARWFAALANQPDPDVIRRYRASVEKVVMLREEVGEDFLRNDIEQAAWSRLNPDADEQMLHSWMTDPDQTPRDDLRALLTAHLSAIDHWFEINNTTYKRRDMRKLVVEPFLRLMVKHGITTSRKQRPRKQIFDALFDWLGIEPKYRPTSANIDAIAREVDTSASSSNATRGAEN